MLLAQIHATAASAWLGVVAAESVLEHWARDEPSGRLVAVVHGWIDLLFEGPLVAIVLASGVVLLVEVWPAKPMLIAKVVCGLVAVIANVICIPLVRARMKQSDNVRIRALTRYIKLTGLAIPFGLGALVLGLSGVALR